MNEFDQAAATWDEKSHRTERASVIAEAIRARVPQSPHLTALEYGCGTGLLSFALQADLGQIFLVDNSAGMLAVLGEKIASSGISNMTPVNLDLITGPLPPFRVQLIYTLMTLHHIDDTAQILRAFYDLLPPDGYLCIADLDAEDGSFHGPEFTGHKGFDREALGRQVKETGFRSVSFTTAYHSPRMVGNEIRHFPVFLLVAEK